MHETKQVNGKHGKVNRIAIRTENRMVIMYNIMQEAQKRTQKARNMGHMVRILDLCHYGHDMRTRIMKESIMKYLQCLSMYN